MRVAVTGASGNVGTAVVRALEREPGVDEIVGIARRGAPAAERPKLSWRRADVLDPAALDVALSGADVVVHLAWAIQPSRDRAQTRAINVDGSRNVFAAAARAGATALVHASSVGAYAPVEGPVRVDEQWPATGIPTSFYSVDKAAAETELDRFEAAHAGVRTVRLRPGLIFQRSAAEEIRRLFAGPFLPSPLLRAQLLPVLPAPEGLRFQAVHADDVADAYHRAVVDPEARGAYNVAAEPVMDGGTPAELFDARPVSVPLAVTRAAADAAWRLRLQPSPPGWIDLASKAPLLETGRIRSELGWSPAHDGLAALRELLDGMRDRAAGETPPLARGAGGPARLGELFRSRVGARR